MSGRFDPNLPATASRLRDAADTLRLDERAFRRAIELAHVAPDRAAWIRGIDRFLFAFGVMAILAGVAAFFAFNWDGLHRLAKFGLVEAGIVAGVAVAAWRGLDSIAGRGALFAAAFLVGTLFVVYGQAYQTGADPYGLFLVWALLIAGWVVIGRQAALWLLLLVLVNLGLILYWTQVLRPDSLGQLGGVFGPLFGLVGAVTDGALASLVFALNALALVAWEVCASRGTGWLRVRWWPRAVSALTLVAVVAGTIFYIFGIEFTERDAWILFSGPLAFALFAVGGLWYYQYRRVDLFILTMILVGAIVCITAFISRTMLRSADVGMLLVLAVLVIAQTAGAAFWIRSIAAREREA